MSFSFDGKEVSVSLYETPDLTEEEALQIVEMYADQLSEHVTGKYMYNFTITYKYTHIATFLNKILIINYYIIYSIFYNFKNFEF